MPYPTNSELDDIEIPQEYSTMTLTPVEYRLGRKKNGTLVLQGKHHITTVNVSTRVETYRYVWKDIETVDLDD